MTPIDRAIQKIDDKIHILTLAKQELVAARDDHQEDAPAPKARKPRQKRIGLSGAQPSSSVANHQGQL